MALLLQSGTYLISLWPLTAFRQDTQIQRPYELWSHMFKNFTLICILPLVLGAIPSVNATSTIIMTCIGNLTNTEADGDTLGQCDLNFISVEQMTQIENVCGIPGSIITPNDTTCRIRAVVSAEPIDAKNHKQLHRVIDVLSINKR